MPIWLMFIPAVAIIQGIIILFVALGQWITGTYYALAPVDGSPGGQVAIVRSASPQQLMHIEARLADGRVFSASFDADDRYAIVRHTPPRSGLHGRAAVSLELSAIDGTTLSCRFTSVTAVAPSAGDCTTPEGKILELITSDRAAGQVTATPLG